MVKIKESLRQKKTEDEASILVKGIFENTKRWLSKDNDNELVRSGYAKINKGKVQLVGYEKIERFLDRLNKKELRVFFRAFLNMTHQAAYHIPSKYVSEFIDFHKNISEEMSKFDKKYSKNGKNIKK